MANAATATWAGRSLIWALVRSAGSPTEPKNLAWGDPTTTASANSDVALFKPQTETRVAGTSTMITTSFLADTYKVTGTLTCLVGAKTITEAGLFDTTTAASTTTVSTVSQSAAATGLTLGATIGPSSNNFYIQVENEVQLVTAGQGTTAVTVTRAQLGSVTAVHATGVTVTSGGDGLANANGATSGQTATGAQVAAKGGNCFAHADFAGVALAVNDSIAFTVTDEFT